MRKIFTLMLIVFSIVMLTACDSEKRQNKKLEENFEAYMSESKGLTRADIDSLMSGSNDLSQVLSTDVKVANTKVRLNSLMSSQYDEIYVWQTNNKIYAAPYNSIGGNTKYPSYVNLEELTAMIGANDLSSNVSLSDALEEAISMALIEAGVPSSYHFDIDEFLKLTSFEFKDFTHNGNGEFQLDNDVLYKKIEKLTDGGITASDIKELLNESDMSFKIFAYFDGEKINSYKIEFSGAGMKVSLELGLPDENTIEINVSMSSMGNKVSLKLKLSDNEISMSMSTEQYVIEADQTVSMKMDFVINEDKMTAKIVQNDMELLNAEISYSVNNNVLAFSGSVVVTDGGQTMNISITSGSSVTIPQICRSNEAYGQNALR